MKSEMESQSSKLMSQSGVISLSEVATVNEITVNPKSFDWLNYTDISSVGIRTVDAPQMMMGENAPSRARRVLRDGDTVLSTVRPNRKSYFQFKDDWERAIASTGFAVISPKSLQDADYLYAVLTSEAATLHYESLCEGGAYPAFNPRAIEEMQIPWPSSEERNVIGGLSAEILKKIRTNFHLAGILEEIAQAIFKSWFVDFEPVKAKMAGEKPVGMDDATAALFPDSMEDSELGPIPKGWHVETVGDICSQLVNGSTPLRSNSDFWDSPDVSWFKTGELSDGFLLESKESISECALAGSSVKVLPKGSVLMAIYAAPTVGRLGILTHDSTFNQACTGMLARLEYGLSFLFLQLKNRREWFNSFAIGAAQQNISKSVVENCPVIVGSHEIHKAFLEIAGLIFDEIECLTLQSADLVKLRDALLPRLISGELQIPDDMLVY